MDECRRHSRGVDQTGQCERRFLEQVIFGLVGRTAQYFNEWWVQHQLFPEPMDMADITLGESPGGLDDVFHWLVLRLHWRSHHISVNDH